MLDLDLNHVLEGIQQAPALIHKAAEHAAAVSAYATKVGHAIAGHDNGPGPSLGLGSDSISIGGPGTGPGYYSSVTGPLPEEQLYPRLTSGSPDELSRLVNPNSSSNDLNPGHVPTPNQLMKHEQDVQFQLQSEHQVSSIKY